MPLKPFENERVNGGKEQREERGRKEKNEGHEKVKGGTREKRDREEKDKR